MSGLALVQYDRNWKVHGDPGGGLTLCGYLCDRPGWSLLTTFGSLHDIDCKRCRAVLLKSGDLSS